MTSSSADSNLPALSFGGHVKAVLVLGAPLVGGHLAQFSIGLTDTIMMGWYSVEGLASVTLAGTLFFILLMFGSGFANAVMPLVAAQAAKGEDVQIRRTTRMALWMSLVFSLIGLPVFWWSEPVMLALGQTEEIASGVQAYLRIAGWGLLPALAIMVLKSYLAAQERTQVVLWATLLGTVVNIFANYALIFGNWGAPEMGIRGSALASLLVQIITLLAILGYALRVLPHHKLLQRIWRPDWDVFWTVARLGVPIGITLLAEVGLFAASSVMMGWLGTIPLAAHAMVLQISSATFIVHLGIATAATVRAGHALGHGDVEHLQRGALAANSLSLAFVACTIAAFLLIPELLLGGFLDPNEPQRDAIISIGVVLLLMSGVFQLVDAAQVQALGLLRGLQDTKVPMIYAAISYWGIGVPASYMLGFPLGFGGAGLWGGLAIGLAFAALTMMWRFWHLGPVLVRRAAT